MSILCSYDSFPKGKSTCYTVVIKNLNDCIKVGLITGSNKKKIYSNMESISKI